MRLSSLLSLILVFMVSGIQAGPRILEVEADRPFFPSDEPLQGLVIVLDPGHGGFAHQGGYTGSARGVNSRVVENDLNMLAAGELYQYLRQGGAKVYLTRFDDRRVTPGETGREEELGARTRKAVEAQAHLFISLHHNAAERRSADGVMILIWPTDSQGKDQPLERILASTLCEEIEKTVHHSEPFDPWINKHPLVDRCDIPSAVIEFGFLTNPEFDEWVSRRGSHRDEARGAYNGIVRMWKEHRKELESLRLKLFPSTDSSSSVVASGEAKTTATMSRSEVIEYKAKQQGYPREIVGLTLRLWPFEEGLRTAQQAQWVLDDYRRGLTDSTIFYLRTEVQEEGDGLRIRGATNYGWLRETAGQILFLLSDQRIRNEIELLPSKRLGDKPFGVVQIPMVMVWGKPSEGDNVQTQLLLGERVFLLDETSDGGYLLLHGGDGYVGWVRREAIARMDEKEFELWERPSNATLIRDYMKGDFRVPGGANLPVIDSEGGSTGKAPDEATTYTLLLPRGVRATEGKEWVRVPGEYLRYTNPLRGDSIGWNAARAAREYLTTPYVFGGRSRIGMDCSGLTSVAYAAAGLMIPRDARQQILTGRVVGIPSHIPPLQTGDLLFFIDKTGRVIHVGISTGGYRYLHCSPPEVQLSSLDSEDSFYSGLWREHFVFARRPAP